MKIKFLYKDDDTNLAHQNSFKRKFLHVNDIMVMI